MPTSVAECPHLYCHALALPIQTLGCFRVCAALGSVGLLLVLGPRSARPPSAAASSVGGRLALDAPLPTWIDSILRIVAPVAHASERWWRRRRSGRRCQCEQPGTTGGATTGAPNAGTTTGSGVNSNATDQRPGGTAYIKALSVK